MINHFEQELTDWLAPCPYFQQMFLVRAALEGAELDGQVVLSPEVLGVDDTYLQRYLRGAGRKRYIVNVAQFNMLQSVPNDGVEYNVSVLDITKKLQDWVQAQAKQKHYPEIGYPILKIETTSVTLAAIDEDGGTKVQFQILIDYFYKE